MDADYPAAHSMDTQWFAVDRDGHVAVFNSGEAGAVPLEAFAGDEAYSATERLCGLLPAGQATYDVRGRGMPGASARPVGRAWAGSTAPVVVLFASREHARDALAAGAEVSVTEGCAVLFSQISEDQLNHYHSLPGCICSFNAYDLLGDSGSHASLARRGFFVYDHLTDNWISGPYGRGQVPARPVHIDSLPADVRRSVASLRFDNLRFADTPHLQPVELTECASWEVAYMDVTGKHIRPIPGKEEEYADAYDELADSDEFEVERPPEAE